MAQRGFPGIHAGAPPIQKPPRGLLEGRAAQARSKQDQPRFEARRKILKAE